jgi:multidrug transporter EmrE-like cation transporter
MWFRLMMITFLLNGLSPFGLRILAGAGLGERYTPIYLFYWYLGGLIFVGIWAFLRGKPPSGSEILVGSMMGLASVCGQFSMGLAMTHGVAGNVVFPIAMGSSIFIVATAGVLIFKERVGPYGKAGIVIGLFAAVLLGFVN